MRPYFIPERSRTKSENNIEREPPSSSIYQQTTDNFLNAINSNNGASMMETCDGSVIMDSASGSIGNTFGAFRVNSSVIGSISNNHLTSQFLRGKNSVLVGQLKKSKSLEDVRAENIDGSQPSHEMEFVSSRIQKLKVQE